ncbi:MAG: BTAD domain-containing putative transcriptional regulator [Caldilineaceae bacterium]
MLKLSLLGYPHITLNGRRITGFITSKAEAVIYYLAVTGRVQGRVALAGLLWPDVPDSVARKNLRDILPNLRQLFGDYLITTRDTATLDFAQGIWLDVNRFRTVLTNAATVPLDALQSAVDLYQDEFLAGFYTRQAPSYETWVLQEREALRVLLLRGLQQLSKRYIADGAYEAALAVNRRHLAIEPWDEEIHRLQMALLALSGQRGAALRQYENCCRILDVELGVAPLPETAALYSALSTEYAPHLLLDTLQRPSTTAAHYTGIFA